MKTSGASDPVNATDRFRKSVRLWLEEMGEEMPLGRFRFCRTRSLVPTNKKRGQGITCFAMKSAWHIGAWQDWAPEVKDGCVQFVKSFQTPDGNFVDPWLLQKIGRDTWLSLAKHGRFREMFADMQDIKARAVRAETRQSAATLMLVGDWPAYPLPMTWRSESAVREFIRSLDWAHPWSAGSHASHLVSFIVMNGRGLEGASLKSQMLEAAFEETDKFLDEKTGTWSVGEVTHVQRINGAMKMLTAYDWAKRSMPYPERLMDYTFDNTSGQDGCGVLDKLFVLQKASAEVPGYRTADLERFALDALNDIGTYHQKDGGFSFYRTHAQRWYYGALVSLGGRQGDMHGTVMFTWACAVALDLLGIRKELGWQFSSP